MQKDILKSMAVRQGYVPAKCTMVGAMVMAFVSGGDDPCVGCNEDRSVCESKRGPRQKTSKRDHR